MKIYTDTVPFAAQKLGLGKDFEEIDINSIDEPITYLIKRLFHKQKLYTLNILAEDYWQYLFIVAKSEESQFDVLINLSSQKIDLPDRLLCIASEGKNFHGFKNRPWTTLQGNLHLSVFLKPNQHIEHFAAAFMVLPAVSIVQAIERIDSIKIKPKIKWVNDIVVNKSKVSGVISSTQIQGNILRSATLGIGLNIETIPYVVPNDFVPKVSCLRMIAKKQDEIDFASIFRIIINNLKDNYNKILNGEYLDLVEEYRKKSLAIGKEVTVIFEEKKDSITGVVDSIGDDLELYIKGIPKPIFDGRLILQ